MDRLQHLRKHIGREQRGIEIGAYHSPIVPRSHGYNSLILDVFDAAELRRQAEFVPHLPRERIAEIEEVDLLGSAGDIADLVRQRCGDERFDYIVSSHNIEHLPDPIRFLQGCEQVLKPGGTISMAIPDRRFCFDFYRPLTELSEWLQAFYEQRSQPTAAQVFRHHAYHSLLRGNLGWSAADQNGDIPTPLETLDTAYSDWRTARDANGDAPYRDCHCWAFSPASFELLISDLQFLGLTRLRVEEVAGPSGCEFYVHLTVPQASASATEDRSEFYRRRSELLKRHALDQSLPMPHSFEEERAKLSAQLAAKDAELRRLEASKSWRMTAPARAVLTLARELRAAVRFP